MGRTSSSKQYVVNIFMVYFSKQYLIDQKLGTLNDMTFFNTETKTLHIKKFQLQVISKLLQLCRIMPME